MDIKGLFGPRMSENEKFKSVVIESTNRVFQNIKVDLDRFTDLVSVDYVNEEFLPEFASMLGFPYIETEDSEIQREMMKRYIQEYKKKGSFEHIVKTATRGYSDNYFLGDMTYYKGKIQDGYASISYPRDKMFRYDYSRWDNGDRWSDKKYVMLGVMDIQTSNYNERTLEYLDKVIPGGIKYYLTLLRDVGSSDLESRYVLYPMTSTSDLWVLMDSYVKLIEKESKKYYTIDIESLYGGSLGVLRPGDVSYSVSQVGSMSLKSIMDKVYGLDLATKGGK